MVAPELRRQTRIMSLPLPLRSALGRHILRSMVAWIGAGQTAGVSIEEQSPFRIYRPHVRQSDAALLWIHGGGYLIGHPKQDDRFLGQTAAELGIMVVSVDYRLAPEHPFPAPLDDCLNAWNWMAESARELAINPDKMVIGGQSAGAGLAAALAQRVSASEGPAPIAQWLFCPMIDDRTATNRSLDSIRHRLWNNPLNHYGWQAYLGVAPGTASLPPYAAAARLADLSPLPPSWLGVGDIDLFHDEAQEYARRLGEAGVDTTLVIVPGAPHGFESWAADAAISKAYLASAREWLRAAINRAAMATQPAEASA